jgi:DNA replication and repair protein RecF
MFFRRVEAEHFRNFNKIAVDFQPGVNLFIGQNAQGKTNLLEALGLLATTKSFRTQAYENLIQTRSDQPCILRGIIVKNDLQFHNKMAVEVSKKRVLVNDRPRGAAWMAAQFPVVLFSPESLQVIKSGPDERRQLIDELVISVNPQASRVIADFKHALRARNVALRNFKNADAGLEATQTLLDSMHGPFLERATALTLARLRAIQEISPHLQEVYSHLNGQKNVNISVDYLISGHQQNLPVFDQIYNALQNRIWELRSAELESGLSLVGPHKHDIRFILDGQDTRFFCSQGQQRTLILSYKLAQIRYHYKVHKDYPLLLLDDVMSELDEIKRGYLVQALSALAAQIIVTTTERVPMVGLESQSSRVFAVRNGEFEVLGNSP